MRSPAAAALQLRLAVAVAVALHAPGTRSATRTAPAPRNLITRNRTFVDRATGEVVQLGGTNVVMKGPPWFPAVSGDDVCHDRYTHARTLRMLHCARAVALHRAAPRVPAAGSRRAAWRRCTTAPHGSAGGTPRTGARAHARAHPAPSPAPPRA